MEYASGERHRPRAPSTGSLRPPCERGLHHPSAADYQPVAAV